MNKLLALLMALFIIPVVYGATIDLSSPSTIIQGETETASFVINSDAVFNGVVYLSYSNIESSVDSVAILNTSFSGSGPYEYQFSWDISGITADDYSISSNLENEANNTLAIDSIQGQVTSSAPIITYKSPTGYITSKSVTLTLTTDESSTCRYDTSNATIYESLSNKFN